MVSNRSIETSAGTRDKNKRIKSLGVTLAALFSRYGIVFVFFALCLVLAIWTPTFLRPKNIINVLRQTSINGILSVGMTFVILTGGIDLSVGSILAFAGMVAATLSSSVFQVHPLFVALGASLLAGLALGAANGAVIAKWRMPPFVVTLGMLSIARGLTYIYTDGMPVANLSKSFVAIGQGLILGIPLPVIIFAAIFIICWITLNKTKFGRYVYAVGGNEKSAKISGINTRLIIFVVYVLSGLMSAIGGLILTARTSAGLPQAGVSYELDAIAAVVIGGTSLKGGEGSLLGTLLGAMILGVINNGLDILSVSSYYQQVIKGLIIIGAVLLDSSRKSKD